MDLIQELKKSRWQRHQDMIIFPKPKVNLQLLSGNHNQHPIILTLILIQILLIQIKN